MILFGSVARDEEKLTSDVDVAVIVQRKDRVIEGKDNRSSRYYIGKI